MVEYIIIALSLTATVYGVPDEQGNHEIKCGDIHSPVACDSSATTASGEPFDPDEVTAALPLPANRIMRPTYIFCKSKSGKRVRIRINDKSNPRWIGKRGLDLSKGAVLALGYTPTDYWSAKLDCTIQKN